MVLEGGTDFEATTSVIDVKTNLGSVIDVKSNLVYEFAPLFIVTDRKSVV